MKISNITVEARFNSVDGKHFCAAFAVEQIEKFKPISLFSSFGCFLCIEDDEFHDVLGGGFEHVAFFVLLHLLRGNDSTRTDRAVA